MNAQLATCSGNQGDVFSHYSPAFIRKNPKMFIQEV